MSGVVHNMEKVRREAVRWHLLVIANVARPQTVNAEAMVGYLQAVYADATLTEVRRQLDYLEERGLVTIAKDPLDNWHAELTRDGIDVVEYTVACDAGISRPRVMQG